MWGKNSTGTEIGSPKGLYLKVSPPLSSDTLNRIYYYSLFSAHHHIPSFSALIITLNWDLTNTMATTTAARVSTGAQELVNTIDSVTQISKDLEAPASLMSISAIDSIAVRQYLPVLLPNLTDCNVLDCYSRTRRPHLHHYQTYITVG